MPRKRTLHSNKFPYHVTTRSNHKTWFQIDMTQVWKLALESLKVANEKHPIRLHAFVLMNNHYHLVLDTPDANIDSFMYEFNKNFSLRLRIETRLINRMFGGRYKWSIIQDIHHYYHVMKYVYLNPNKAELVNDARDYPYSTLFVQKQGLDFPTKIRPYFNPLDKDFISWMHKMHSAEQNDCIKRGLRRGEFRLSGTRERRTPPSFDVFG